VWLVTEDLWPTEIRLSADRRVLNVAFEDGAGHSPLERKVIGGKRAVAILAVEPIGNYAVKLGFDDMHDTGIYGWGYLHTLGREYETRWTTYLTELAERGLDRETARTASVKQGGGCGSGSCGCH
jgi:DUF971 family protein